MPGLRRERPCWGTRAMLSMMLLLPSNGFVVPPPTGGAGMDIPKQTVLFGRASDMNEPTITTRARSPMEILSAPLQIDLRNATALEMVGMSAVGLTFSLGVIFALASSGTSTSSGEEVKALERTLATVADVTLPADATDILTVALGESLGGFIGALSTSVVMAVLRLRMDVPEKSLLAEAVADGDYFLTRAAAFPLLEAIGVPTAFASFTSVVLATIPYQFVKLKSKRQQQRRLEEDLMMEELLRKEKKKEQGRWSTKKGEDEETFSLESSIVPPDLDFPEMCTDVIKWLEYQVLCSDFGRTLHGFDGNLLPSGAESAIFGFLAGASSLLYLDIVRTYTDYGPESKRTEAQTRNFAGWVSLYTTESLSSAALFGVYETARKPVSVFVADILSRGVDGCIGSSDFQGCVETYVANNPPEASLDAQVRSLATAVASLWDRLSIDGAYDTDQLARGAIVQMYNIFNHAMPAFEQHYSTLPVSMY